MKNISVDKSNKENINSKLVSYIVGFVLSLVLTIGSYFLVMFHLSSGHRVPTDQTMSLLLPALAIFQLIVQLIFFLHVAKSKTDEKMRWNLFVFLSTVGIILIIIIGSFWIMNHLNYNMSSRDMNMVIQSEEGIMK